MNNKKNSLHDNQQPTTSNKNSLHNNQQTTTSNKNSLHDDRQTTTANNLPTNIQYNIYASRMAPDKPITADTILYMYSDSGDTTTSSLQTRLYYTCITSNKRQPYIYNISTTTNDCQTDKYIISTTTNAFQPRILYICTAAKNFKQGIYNISTPRNWQRREFEHCSKFVTLGRGAMNYF